MVRGVQEHAGERVVVLRRDRVVLVVVAAGAADRQPEEAARHHVDAIVPLVRARDFDGAVVVEPGSEPEEPERGQRARPRRRVAEQIAGQLRADELVVRQVVVERLDDPVAIQIRVRVRVVAALVGIERAVVVLAVARDVEPQPAPRLAVVRRRQQPIDDLCERVRRVVLLEGVDLLGVGGRPIRSSVARRSSVRLSAERAPARARPARGARARTDRCRSSATTGGTQPARARRGSAETTRTRAAPA